MQVKDVSTEQRFSDQKMQKVGLFETPRAVCDVYCFEPGQSQRIHVHHGMDKIYYVLEGEGTFYVGSEEQTVGKGNAVFAPSETEHGVVNENACRLTCLVFMAPSPNS